MRHRLPHFRSHRRGVTLVEMLVAVTLLVLMMTVIVTIFSSATGAVSGLQAFQQLDGDLRQLDITIRQDLIGITARMTPPLNPRNNLGYFEYGENAFADLQSEDTDDYVRFTAKAPEGQPFMGRVWLAKTNNPPLSSPQPAMVTSNFAEIIYFLRNGNLYRRVFLIAPERQVSVNGVVSVISGSGTALSNLGTFQPLMVNGLNTSWQGVNDLSAHPAPSGSTAALTHPIILNTLGDLTNRENRAFYSRFANDYVNHITNAATPDGIPDDQNPDPVDGSFVGNGVPDFYPTLYSLLPQSLLGEDTSTFTRFVSSSSAMAFPYLFPGAYSKPDTYTGAITGAGWIHSTDPITGTASTATLALNQLTAINHSPLQSGESPLVPPAGLQTFWGFPTWKETLLPQWNDPYTAVSNGTATTGVQPRGLTPLVASASPALGGSLNALPYMSELYRNTAQPYNDSAGSDLFSTAPSANATRALWRASWEDDLIMTGVRSFDIKAYDDSYGGYVDLGWGDDLRLQPTVNPTGAPTTFLSQQNGLQFVTGTPDVLTTNNGSFYTVSQTLAHEGRIPPRVNDLRFDAQFSPPAWNFNVGDDQAGVQRLRRVWDSWSTDYSQAPATGFDPTTKLPIGPPWTRPVYPSYPAPYPVALRGIQIQIKVVDPRNEKVKTLTIRQDFSDKL